MDDKTKVIKKAITNRTFQKDALHYQGIAANLVEPHYLLLLKLSIEYQDFQALKLLLKWRNLRLSYKAKQQLCVYLVDCIEFCKFNVEDVATAFSLILWHGSYEPLNAIMRFQVLSKVIKMKYSHNLELASTILYYSIEQKFTNELRNDLLGKAICHNPAIFETILQHSVEKKLPKKIQQYFIGKALIYNPKMLPLILGYSVNPVLPQAVKREFLSFALFNAQISGNRQIPTILKQHLSEYQYQQGTYKPQEAVIVLLELETDPNQTDSQDYNAFQLACINQQWSLLKKLLMHPSVECIDINKQTMLEGKTILHLIVSHINDYNQKILETLIRLLFIFNIDRQIKDYQQKIIDENLVIKNILDRCENQCIQYIDMLSRRYGFINTATKNVEHAKLWAWLKLDVIEKQTNFMLSYGLGTKNGTISLPQEIVNIVRRNLFPAAISQHAFPIREKKSFAA